jgi:hypothetical protein
LIFSSSAGDTGLSGSAKVLLPMNPAATNAIKVIFISIPPACVSKAFRHANKRPIPDVVN